MLIHFYIFLYSNIQGCDCPMLQNTEKHWNPCFSGVLNMVKEKRFWENTTEKWQIHWTITPVQDDALGLKNSSNTRLYTELKFTQADHPNWKQDVAITWIQVPGGNVERFQWFLHQYSCVLKCVCSCLQFREDQDIGHDWNKNWKHLYISDHCLKRQIVF